jgi:hypothetical protein
VTRGHGCGCARAAAPGRSCGVGVLAVVAAAPGSCVWSLLVLVEAGQQAEGALEYLGCDQAGG